MFCRKIRDARRYAKLSQSELSAEVGCKQSALSMFEQGDGTKLNDEVVAKIAAKFGIEMPAAAAATGGLKSFISARAAHTAFCPNPHCPTNRRYDVDGAAFVKPDRVAADPSGGRFCAMCGEVLETACPSCGAPVNEGAVCTFCGSAYVSLRQASAGAAK